MTVLVVMCLGLGVFLVYDGLTRRRLPSTRVSVSARSRSWLCAAGLDGVGPTQFGMASAITGAIAGAAVLVVIGSVGVAFVATLAGLCGPTVYYRNRRRGLRASRRRGWPEAIELLAGAVRAGDTLPAAIGVVADRGPESLRLVFRDVVSDHRVSGDLVAALERMGARVADPTADRIVRTMVLAHRVGGRELGRVLRTLSAFLRDDVAARREIESRQSWTVVAARVSASAPWLVLVLVASRPQGAQAFDSPTGIGVLLGGAVVTALGYRMMMRLGRLPDEPRVLAVEAVAP